MSFDGIPEFKSADELRAHYRAIFAKRNGLKYHAPIVTAEIPQKQERDWIFVETHRVALREIIDAVLAESELTLDQFTSAERKPYAVKWRFVYFYLARELTAMSLPVIGRLAGGRDHSTVLHGVRSVRANLHKYADRIAAVKARIAGIE